MLGFHSLCPIHVSGDLDLNWMILSPLDHGSI